MGNWKDNANVYIKAGKFSSSRNDASLASKVESVVASVVEGEKAIGNIIDPNIVRKYILETSDYKSTNQRLLNKTKNTEAPSTSTGKSAGTSSPSAPGTAAGNIVDTTINDILNFIKKEASKAGTKIALDQETSLADSIKSHIEEDYYDVFTSEKSFKILSNVLKSTKFDFTDIDDLLYKMTSTLSSVDRDIAKRLKEVSLEDLVAEEGKTGGVKVNIEKYIEEVFGQQKDLMKRILEQGKKEELQRYFEQTIKKTMPEVKFTLDASTLSETISESLNLSIANTMGTLGDILKHSREESIQAVKEGKKFMREVERTMAPQTSMLYKMLRTRQMSEEEFEEAIEKSAISIVASIDSYKTMSDDMKKRVLEATKERLKQRAESKSFFVTLDDFYKTRTGKLFKETVESAFEPVADKFREALGEFYEWFQAAANVGKAVWEFFNDTESKDDIQIGLLDNIEMGITSGFRNLANLLDKNHDEIFEQNVQNELEDDREKRSLKDVLLGVLKTAAITVTGALFGALYGLISLRMKPFIWVIEKIVSPIKDITDLFIDFSKITTKMVDWLLISLSYFEKIPRIGKFVTQAFDFFMDIGKVFTKIGSWVSGLASSTKWIGVFIKGFTVGLSKLALPLQILLSIFDFVTGWMNSTKTTIMGKLGDAIWAVIDGFFGIIVDVFGWVIDKIFGTEDSAGKIMGAVKWLFDTIWGVLSWVVDSVMKSWNFITDNWYKLNPIYWTYKALEAIAGFIIDIINGESLIKSVQENLIDPIVGLLTKVKDFIAGQWESIKSFFGFGDEKEEKAPEKPPETIKSVMGSLEEQGAIEPASFWGNKNTVIKDWGAIEKLPVDQLKLLRQDKSIDIDSMKKIDEILKKKEEEQKSTSPATEKKGNREIYEYKEGGPVMMSINGTRVTMSDADYKAYVSSMEIPTTVPKKDTSEDYKAFVSSMEIPSPASKEMIPSTELGIQKDVKTSGIPAVLSDMSMKEAKLKQIELQGQKDISDGVRKSEISMIKKLDENTKSLGGSFANYVQMGGQNSQLDPPVDIETLSILFFNKTWGIT